MKNGFSLTSSYRRVVITINNWTPQDLFAFKYLAKNAVYAIAGAEVGEKGTPHIQGFIHLPNAKKGANWKKALPRAHFIPASGDDHSNKKYCSKEEQVLYEVGEPTAQGSRTDIKEITDKIRNLELSMDDIMWDYPDMYLRYHKAFEKMYSSLHAVRTDPPQVVWLWGKSGTGKTRFAVEEHKDSHYIKDNTIWWDGYNQQEAIIIDDFDGDIPFRVMLRMLDRYQYQGQIKGGYVHINSNHIYITSEFPPSYYYGESDNRLKQITRRLTSVIEMK